MSYSADLHLHSSHSYACSKNLTLENIAAWAKLKGIDLLASGDFTHPKWRQELGAKLVPDGSGMYAYGGVYFVLGTEVSCVYRQGGRTRRVHLLLLAPDFDAVDQLRAALVRGKNKMDSDGRPTLKMSARDLTALALGINPACIIIPAHVWTPWYGLFGSKSGFDSLEECFQDMTPEIHAVESGLSSDPEMIWPVGELENRTIVSFSDAHSPAKLGRELTVFEGEPSYQSLSEALNGQGVEFTVEFYPEEGKYHYDGHRKCGVRQSPAQTRQQGNQCPVCQRPLTLGVLHRLESLASISSAKDWGTASRDDQGFVHHSRSRPPFIKLAPLTEIIATGLGMGTGSKRVHTERRRLTQELGSELNVLLSATASDLEKVAGERLATAILKVRLGEVELEPGYDGVYGKVMVPMD